MKMAEVLCLPGRAETRIASARSRALTWSPQTYSTMRGNSWSPIEGDRNVICFRLRASAPRHELGLGSYDTRNDFPISDLRTHEYASKNDDDYRHRMLVNFLATIVAIVLIVTGSWLMDRIISSWP
jgi:hypothetical protein